MLTYSVTINVSPFKRLFDGSQFAKLCQEEQESLLQGILNKVKSVTRGEYGVWVYEPTKRGHPHLHTLFKVDKELTKGQMVDIKDISEHFGNSLFNKVIYIEKCKDDGSAWLDYMMKVQTPEKKEEIKNFKIRTATGAFIFNSRKRLMEFINNDDELSDD